MVKLAIPRIVEPKTKRGRRIIKSREAKLIENTKQALFMHGNKTSNIVRNLMKDLYSIKKRDAVYFSRKHEILPFESALRLERFCMKRDLSLFAYCTHSKKRPHNLILGRMFDFHVLDMIEFGVSSFASLSEFKNAKIKVGNKPFLIFCGRSFEDDSTYIRIKSLLVDFFGGGLEKKICLQGIEHLVLFSAVDNTIHFRSYRIYLKKSGVKVPKVELQEIGPSGVLTLRRTQLASEDLYATAMKEPQELKAKKKKNKEEDEFGTKLGRVHMEKQDMGKLQTRKLKALKKSIRQRKEERGAYEHSKTRD